MSTGVFAGSFLNSIELSLSVVDNISAFLRASIFSMSQQDLLFAQWSINFNFPFYLIWF